jgi:hypothetical protein
MKSHEQYTSEVSECEVVARNRGHVLGVWQRVDERLHASVCELCTNIAWVSRSDDEECWRMGGSVLSQACLEYDLRRSSSGALKR